MKQRRKARMATLRRGAFICAAGLLAASVTLISVTLLLAVGISPVMAQDSSPLDEWHWRNPLPQGDPLQCLVHAEGRFLALGAGRTALSSPDGREWAEEESSWHRGGVECVDLAYGNGVYVVVTFDYFGFDHSVSDDGLTWGGTSLSRDQLTSVSFGAQTFVAVGQRIATSSDGTHWNITDIPAGGPPVPPNRSPFLYGVTYAGDLFIAVGWSGAILTSTDAEQWAYAASPVNVDLHDAAFGGGTYVAVGEGGTIVRSSDAQQWTEVDSPVDMDLRRVVHDGSGFVAVGADGTVLTSADGSQWRRASTGTDARLIAAATGEGRYVLVGESGAMLYSDDARRWHLVSRSVTNRALLGLASDGRRLVAVGGTILTSEDGVEWRRRNAGTRHGLSDVVHAERLFVAVGTAGTVLTSPNGIGWAPRRAGTSQDLHGVAYGNGLYVAVGAEGRVITSRDGRRWDSHDSGHSGRLWGVAFGGGRFVATTGGRTVLTSTDGRRWTPVDVGVEIVELYNVTYGAGRFVAVGGDESTQSQAVVSEDGLNWQGASRGPGADGFLVGVTYSHGTFVAVGSGYFEDTPIFSSPDGHTWQHHDVRADSSLSDVLFAHGTFIAVGSGGTILESSPYLAARPAFSVRGGTYRQPQHVTISTRTEGATIRYTTDGRLPSCTRGTEIASGGFVTLERDAVLQAVACAEGYGMSELRKETYRFRGHR